MEKMDGLERYRKKFRGIEYRFGFPSEGRLECSKGTNYENCW